MQLGGGDDAECACLWRSQLNTYGGVPDLCFLPYDRRNVVVCTEKHVHNAGNEPCLLTGSCNLEGTDSLHTAVRCFVANHRQRTLCHTQHPHMWASYSALPVMPADASPHGSRSFTSFAQSQAPSITGQRHTSPPTAASKRAAGSAHTRHHSHHALHSARCTTHTHQLTPSCRPLARTNRISMKMDSASATSRTCSL